MRGDTRAISPAVTQALTIGISTILITGLLIGGSSFSKVKTDSTVRQGLQDVGSGVASDLVRLDKFNTSDVSGTVSFTSDYPDRVGGKSYDIRLVPGPDFTTIYVNSTSSDLGTAVQFVNETAVCGGTVSGGQLNIAYDSGAECLVVGDA